jgi:hypothetical protein
MYAVVGAQANAASVQEGTRLCIDRVKFEKTHIRSCKNIARFKDEHTTEIQTATHTTKSTIRSTPRKRTLFSDNFLP